MSIPFWTRRGTIDLAKLLPGDLTPEIMADTLAKIPRFGGRTIEPFSVAEHSVLVERLCPIPLGPWALLHDAHEIFLGDITTPAVEMIATYGKLPALDTALAIAKGKIDRMVASAWNTPVRSLNDELRKADRIALCAEAIVHMGASPDPFEPGDRDEIDRAISILLEMPCSDWRAARDLWMSRVEHYSAVGGLTPPQAV